MRLHILFLAVLSTMIYEYHCDAYKLNQTLWDFDSVYEDNKSSDYKNDKYYNKNDDDDEYNNKKNYKNDDNDDDDGYNNKKDSKKDDGKYDIDVKDDDDNGYNNNDDDYEPSKSRSSRKRKSPDDYGNMNFYFREPSKDGKRKKPKRMRFPVHRFERDRFPPFPPLLSFLPWLPIFADRLTKQTIIYSPTGGVYIIPPVINFYGQRFSIAELIASGYVSLVSSGAPPPPAVDVAPLVQPGPVTGPGIPPANPATGGFKGGVRTEFRSFPRPSYSKTVEEEGSRSNERSKSTGGGYNY